MSERNPYRANTEKEITCPQCHRNIITQTQNIIHSTDPSAMAKVMGGTLWLRECPYCHEKFMFLYPTVYENKETKAIIIFIADKKKDTIFEQQLILKQKISDGKATLRVVDNIDHFREKIQEDIQGVDDRIIEVLKILWFHILKNDYIKYETADALCWVEDDGTLEITYINQNNNESMIVCRLPKSTYGLIQKELEMELRDANDIQTNIDKQFGLELLEEYENNNKSVEKLISILKRMNIKFHEEG